MKRAGWLLALLLLSGCFSAHPRVHELGDAQILADTVWEGIVRIDGTVHVAKGATLTIRPGSEIRFVRRDADADGLGDATLAVEGRLLAVGSREQPIVFRSAEEQPRAGDWLEIRVDFSRETQLRYCEIRDSAYTLHAHFTQGMMTDSHVHHNIDGCRLGETTFLFRNNLFEDNLGKGINFRNASVEIEHNIIRRNGSGIFLFETDKASKIHHNNIYDNEYNLRLGDFFTGAVKVNDNWWGSSERKWILKTIYDRRSDPRIGTVSVRPAAQWVDDCGPRDAFALREIWQVATDGFVDAAVTRVGDNYLIASWDGTLRMVNADGVPVWQRQLGDVIDATPAWDGQRLYVQTWGRNVFAFSASGEVLWRFATSPSPADDHRQGALLPAGQLVLLPSWNGSLYALDAASGERRWQYDAGEALRAAPAYDDDRLYLAGSGGTLTALALDGTVLWQAGLDEALLSTPAVTGAGVVVVSRRGEVACFDRSGRPLWKRNLGELCHYSSPLATRTDVYVGTSGGSLWKLRLSDGAIVWRRSGFGPIYAPLALRDRRLYFGDNDGALSVVDADSGTVVSSFRIDGEIQGKAWVEADRVLIGTRDRNVYALRRESQAVAP